MVVVGRGDGGVVAIAAMFRLFYRGRMIEMGIVCERER